MAWFQVRVLFGFQEYSSLNHLIGLKKKVAKIIKNIKKKVAI